jgi:hypothetical protein
MPLFPKASSKDTPSWLSSSGGAQGSETLSSTHQHTNSTTKSSQNEPSWLSTEETEDDDIQQELQQLPQIQGVVTVDNPTSTTSTAAAPLGDDVSPSPNPTQNGKTKTSAAEAARAKTWGQYFRETFKRDGRLLLITVAILIVMNIPYLNWVLYPFTIFSTWIHELCHGLAAILAGGRINKLLIFTDTSGLAYTSGVSAARRGFVASAGYQGTAVIGCLLLLVRRTKRGPRTGTMGIAFLMVLSVILWIRNAFGIVFVGVMGLVLGGVAWKLPSTHMRNVYVCLAVTTCLNAITSVHNLFGSSQMVNGEPSSTDAHTMAELKGGTSITWAILWLILALILTFTGIVFAIPGTDEVADFVWCGVCQDFGAFRICNFDGRRLCQKLFSRGGNGTNTSPTNVVSET